MSSAAKQPSEAGSASLLDDSLDEALTPERCDLDHWFQAAGSEYAALRHGHAPGASPPAHMLEPGPLRAAMLREMAFRACAEEAAVRGIAHMVRCAPNHAAMDFYATQLLDEARHAYVFRWHLVELGLPAQDVMAEIERLVGAQRRSTIVPVEAFFQDHGERGDFMGCVVILAVIAEGALAPAAEMSERKWRVLDAPAAQIAEGANRDEVRHLAVGSSIVRQHVLAHPAERERLQDLIRRGMELWDTIPIADVLAEREAFFQRGLEEHARLLGGYELVPGRPLADTTAEERLEIQLGWSAAMRERRLAFMGLSGV